MLKLGNCSLIDYNDDDNDLIHSIILLTDGSKIVSLKVKTKRQKMH